MIEMLPTTPEDKQNIDRVIRLIATATKNESAHIMAQALSFYLFGVVTVIADIAQPDDEAKAVRCCIQYFENYIEQLKWGGNREVK